MKILKSEEYSEKLKIQPIKISDLDSIDEHEYEWYPESRGELIDTIEYFMSMYGPNCSLNSICTSKIYDFHELFKYIEPKFKGDVSKWDMSNAKTTICMFENCFDFNSDISRWDVSNVEDMHGMFYNCQEFNQNLNNWNVSKVKDMSGMFNHCHNFDNPLDKWKDKLKNVKKMRQMFQDNFKFNQDLSIWDISNVEEMDYMFSNCYELDQDFSKWNLDGKSANAIFYDCRKMKPQNIPYKKDL